MGKFYSGDLPPALMPMDRGETISSFARGLNPWVYSTSNRARHIAMEKISIRLKCP
uniref:Uncharacterized protein n=1 Tax=uncultured bacterium contig00061 TaxID=1181544 RepID=A0A806KCH1_9BACT|nr:hypothetical protein [uncultured bacterium contig00061]